ncbi:enoyl-CoA hydratase [Candidatus Sororendozoicomonas aggregata]|uniref:enoyl-CoA hydratase n=1 Tax=Candidatus Sororendozoicomonas aggregata TaxID=3073239 RepID=UPI002ED30AED
MVDVLQLSVEAHTAFITLDNPPANTWTLASLQRLESMIREINGNREVTTLIIRSAREKFFSAGADLNVFNHQPPKEVEAMAAAFGKGFEALTDFSGLSIAAINGYAMGGGLEVALACDLLVAEKQAVMALPEASVGLLPCAGGTQNLTLRVGEGWAKRMILCGEKVDGAKAHAIGLVDVLVEEGESVNTAKTFAKKALRQSPDAVRACKQLIQLGREMPPRSALPMERELFMKLFEGNNQQEGVSAFLEKRQPVWDYD